MIQQTTQPLRTPTTTNKALLQYLPSSNHKCILRHPRPKRSSRMDAHPSWVRGQSQNRLAILSSHQLIVPCPMAVLQFWALVGSSWRCRPPSSTSMVRTRNNNRCRRTRVCSSSLITSSSSKTRSKVILYRNKQVNWKAIRRVVVKVCATLIARAVTKWSLITRPLAIC